MKKVARKAFWSMIGVGLMAFGLTMGVAPSNAGALQSFEHAQTALSH